MGFQTVTQWMADHWDREAYLVVMRRIEILLLNNLQDKAVSVLRQFVGWSRPEAVSLASPVQDVLPVRVARSLEESGYDTLAAADGATDSELMALRNIGSKTIRLIRAAADAARCGQRLPEYISDRASELRPEFEIDWDYFQQFAPRWNELLLEFMKQQPQFESRKTMSVSTETNPPNPLATLLKSMEQPEATVAQIDKEITQKETELANLKRLRKLLVPASAPRSDRPTRSTSDWTEFEQQIIAVVAASGPLRPKDIHQQTGLDTGHIGRIAKASALLTRLPDGKIAAA